ncbi:HWE histidine kinase domain-containing protein [Sinorhizobium terangae]|uniref:HWE histidine kinase domain-containing protein n=1 Tax=Sinorhizobium terangae TaxID=110322 RepID=UPI003D15F648
MTSTSPSRQRWKLSRRRPKRSLYESRSLDEFRDSFATRLGALSRTQDLLMRAPAHDVLMAEVLRLELEAQGAMKEKMSA